MLKSVRQTLIGLSLLTTLVGGPVVGMQAKTDVSKNMLTNLHTPKDAKRDGKIVGGWLGGLVAATGIVSAVGLAKKRKDDFER